MKSSFINLAISSFSLWLREKIHEFSSSVDFFRQFRVRLLAPLLGLKEGTGGSIQHKMSNHCSRIVTGPFKLRRMTDRAGRANFRADAAVHALGKVRYQTDSSSVFIWLLAIYNRDARNGTFSFACLAICANHHIDLEVFPIPFRQRFLNRSIDLIRILDGEWSAHKMGKSNRKPLNDRSQPLQRYFEDSQTCPVRSFQGNLCPGFRTTRRSGSTVRCCGSNSTDAGCSSRERINISPP